MSSMAEGSEGWDGEDGLSLGREDGIPRQTDHFVLALDHPKSSPQQPVEEDLDTIDNARDQASEKTVELTGPELPQTPPAQSAQLNVASGSLDETASTPDDTPSLHVSDAIGARAF